MDGLVSLAEDLIENLCIISNCLHLLFLEIIAMMNIAADPPNCKKYEEVF